MHSFGSLDAGIEPQVIAPGVQDHGHPVMKRPDEVVRGDGEKRARVDGRPACAFPVLP